MAELNEMICPACGEPLAEVPGFCPACTTFCPSVEEIVDHPSERGMARRDDQSSSIEDEPRDIPQTLEGQDTPADMLPCGHPGTPGEPCPWCGAVSGEPRGRACLVVGDERLSLPDGVEIVLGRESPWVQVADLFDRLRRMDGPIGEAARGVSRRHAAVTIIGRRCRVADLGSLNGTWIDRRELGVVPVTRDLPLTFQLGIPRAGLMVELVEDEPDERQAYGLSATRWTGEKRD